MQAVEETCMKDLAKSSKQMKTYVDQSRIEPPTFEPSNLVMLHGTHIKTHRLAPKLEYKIYRPFEILYLISPMAVCLSLLKMWTIHPIFPIFLIEPFVKGNRDFDINAILKTSNPIENAQEYDIDKVMGSKDNARKVLYRVKWKG
jgi:hypothetical protein